MSSIQFNCPQGHSVKAKSELAGKLAKCPRCQSVMLIPEPVQQLPSVRNITESAVMRILGDATPLPAVPEKSMHVSKSCPRCKKSLRQSVTICDGCQLYVGLTSVRDTRSTLSEYGA